MVSPSVWRLKKRCTTPKSRRNARAYTSIAIGVGLGTLMAMCLHVNGVEKYELHELSLPRRLGIWPPPVPGFKENNDADNEDYPHSSVYQETITQHWENVILCIPYSLVCLYMLLGLNTVCDAYFTGALDVMVNKWQITPDVAGATFMAAGGSAPEFFTSIIGACLAESDVGFGTIVGSAVFNVLFVIGACGVAAGEAIPLSWWPLFRDCTFYIIGLGLLSVFCMTATGGRDFSGKKYDGGNPIVDGKRMGCPDIPGIQHYEAILLFLLYCGYCGMMFFNEGLEKWITEFGKGKKAPKKNQVAPAPTPETNQPTNEASKEVGGDKLKDAANADDKPPTNEVEQATNEVGTSNENEVPRKKVSIHMQHHYPHEQKHGHGHEHGHGQGSKEGTAHNPPETNSKKEKPDEEPPETKVEVPENQEKENEDDEEEDDIEEMMVIPEETAGKIIWYLCSPIYAHLYYCTPKPSEEKFCGCFYAFIACFLTSLLWIAIYSTILVWLVTEIGAVFGFPEIVMGFTVLAAGTSIPDLVSSMAVARAGQGDMAVSSSIGSNIFDILVGLPIPWLVKILIVEGCFSSDPDFLVVIQSPYIPFYVLLLLAMVACVVITIHLMQWKLNKWLGVVMVVFYCIFLGIVLPTSYDQMTGLNFAQDGRVESPKATCPPDPLKY